MEEKIMSAGLPNPIVPVIMVVPTTPPQPQVSPRALAQEVQKLGSVVERLTSYCKPLAEDLNLSAASLEHSAGILERLGKYEQKRAQLEEQCQHLQNHVTNLKGEIEKMSGQLEVETKAALESENKKKELKKTLEEVRQAVKGWEKAAMEQYELREAECLKRQEAEERARTKAADAERTQHELQVSREVNAMLVTRLRDRAQENQAMHVHNQALQAEIYLHRQDKANLEQTVRQQKAVLQQKDQHIQAQGQRIYGLEGRIQEQKGDVAHIQKQVIALKEGLKVHSGQKASGRMQRIARIALAVLTALGITLSLALVFWLSPSLALSTPASIGKGALGALAVV